MKRGILVALFLATAAAHADTVPSEVIGTVGAGTSWESTVYAAYDERQFFPFQGCLSPKDGNAYVAALADKASRDQLQRDFDSMVEPTGSPFRKLLGHVADPATKLTSEIESAELDTLSGPRTAYWPEIHWSDNGTYGRVGFESCTSKSFQIARKLTRVVRAQTVTVLTQTTEPLVTNGQPAPITLKISTIAVTETAPEEAPGTVQLLQNGTKHDCFTAQDEHGNAVNSFSGYTPGSDGYQIHFPELTRQLKNDLTLVKALSPFYQYAGNAGHYPTAKSNAYGERYGSPRVEQQELGIQIGLCRATDVPYSTDRQEYLYLTGI
jgi:hypothetical protein